MRKFLFFVFLFSVLGCNETPPNEPPEVDGGAVRTNDSGPGQPGMSCGQVCIDRAVDCGAPPEMAPGVCAELCGPEASGESIACLSSTSCGELVASFFRSGTVCGLGSQGTDAGAPTDRDAGAPTDRDAGGAACLELDERDCSSVVGTPWSCCDGLVCYGEWRSSGANYQRCCVPMGGSCEQPSDCCGHNPEQVDPRLTPGCWSSTCGYP